MIPSQTAMHGAFGGVDRLGEACFNDHSRARGVNIRRAWPRSSGELILVSIITKRLDFSGGSS